MSYKKIITYLIPICLFISSAGTGLFIGYLGIKNPDINYVPSMMICLYGICLSLLLHTIFKFIYKI